MEIGVRFVGLLQLIIQWFTLPFYFLWSFKSVEKLPPIRNFLLLTSASTLAKKIRKKEVTSESVVRAFIERVKEVNPYLNAVVEDRYSEAIKDAQEIDKLLESGFKSEEQIEKDTPLLGVPLTVKESCGVRGLSQCGGSIPRLGIKATKDGEAVKQLKKAGVIPILVSNTPELCLGWETNNLVTGRTGNSYNLLKTCGGSSGGEAALISAGSSVIGIGSDLGGSIRLPAMFNGIFGHKPTPGYVSIDGHYPMVNDINFTKYLVIGPITRYAEDLKPMLSAMAGEKAFKLKLYDKVDLQNIQVFFMEEAGYSLVMPPVEKDIKNALHKVVKHLSNKYNMSVNKANFKEMEDSAEISIAVLFGLEGIPNALENSEGEDNLFLEFVKSIFGVSKYSLSLLLFYLLKFTNVFIPKKKYNYYYEQSEALAEKFMDVLGDNGIFLYPTHPTAAYYHNEVFFKTAGVFYTMVFNILGLPSTHVPLGFNREGMPIGIQVVAGPHQDRLCLTIAEVLEKDLGGWVPSSEEPFSNYSDKKGT